MSSASLRLLMVCPCTFIPCTDSHVFCIAHSMYIGKTFGDMGWPCLTPFSCLNYSPRSAPTLTAAFAFLYILLRMMINFPSTLCDSRRAQIMSGLTLSNAFEAYEATVRVISLLRRETFFYQP